MKFGFTQVDVFTAVPLRGNPLAVVHGADGLGNLDYVAREVVKAEELVDYTRRENVGLRLAKRFGASVGEGIFLAARSAGVQLR